MQKSEIRSCPGAHLFPRSIALWRQFILTNFTPLKLKQKYLFERREFFLEPERIRVFVKDLDGETEIYIQYEAITPNTRNIVRQDGKVYIAAISFGIFALVGFGLNFAGISALIRWSPLWAIASIIFLGFHLYKYRRYFLIDLSDNKSIFFLANQPSKEKLQNFVKSLYQIRREYIRKKYFVLNPENNPDAEVSRFKFLLEQEIISEPEFQKMKSAIITRKGFNELQANDYFN